MLVFSYWLIDERLTNVQTIDLPCCILDLCQQLSELNKVKSLFPCQVFWQQCTHGKAFTFTLLDSFIPFPIAVLCKIVSTFATPTLREPYNKYLLNWGNQWYQTLIEFLSSIPVGSPALAWKHRLMNLAIGLAFCILMLNVEGLCSQVLDHSWSSRRKSNHCTRSKIMYIYDWTLQRCQREIDRCILCSTCRKWHNISTAVAATRLPPTSNWKFHKKSFTAYCWVMLFTGGQT